MKSIKTWVLLANSQVARIVVNEGPGKGFQVVEGAQWVADPAIEHADAATMSYSRVGEGQRRVERSSPKVKAEADFASQLGAHLAQELHKGSYERLLIVAAPHMLGELRHHLSKEVSGITIAQIPKDLVVSDLKALPSLLGNHIAA